MEEAQKQKELGHAEIQKVLKEKDQLTANQNTTSSSSFDVGNKGK